MGQARETAGAVRSQGGGTGPGGGSGEPQAASCESLPWGTGAPVGPLCPAVPTGEVSPSGQSGPPPGPLQGEVSTGISVSAHKAETSELPSVPKTQIRKPMLKFAWAVPGGGGRNLA